MRHSLSRAVLGIAFVCPAALANPIFFGTHGNTLYRTDGVTVESFTLSDNITALAVDDNGIIWATSPRDSNGNGFRELYTILDPTGPAPSLQLEGDFLSELTPTITFVDGTMYGFQRTAPGPLTNGALIIIDPDAQTEQIVGDTGAVGGGFAGSGYDPDSDTFFMSTSRPNDTLNDVDYSLSSGTDPTGTELGQIDFNFRNHGAEFYQGEYFLFGESQDSTMMILGSVDVDTLAFNEILQIPIEARGSVGLAIIPEPSCLALLLAGGIGGPAIRRRLQR